jgi:hypothetical protein
VDLLIIFIKSMKKMVFILAGLAGHAIGVFAQFGTPPPFTFEIEPVTGTNLPGYHSFAFAQQGSKWLIVGGRTNGLHGMSSNDGFDPMYNNNDMVVIDTNGWQVYTSSLSVLPYAVADPIRSTNAQFFADTGHLYIFGGYGRDSVMNRFTTFSTITAIRIDSMIDAVMNNTSIAPYIRQITDTNFRVCGGALGKIGNAYYLAFGHDFQGRYTDPPTPLFTQVYSRELKKFNIADNGSVFSITNYTEQTDTNNFHRRDLNVVPEIMPNGDEALGVYAGVFRKNVNLPWLEPLRITSTGVSVGTYQQQMNHYTCANIPIYDSVTQKMYVTFFGGISLNDYSPQSNTISMDTLVPFVADITTFRKDPNGYMEETVLPLQMPGLLGSNAQFVQREDIPVYTNGVIRFRDLPNTRTLAGYMFGGIRATGTNLMPSTANDTVYRVFITPDFLPGYTGSELIGSFRTFPNPFTGSTRIVFQLKGESAVRLEAFDITGKKMEEVASGTYAAGNHQLEWKPALAKGMYFLKLSGAGGSGTIKIIIH